MNVIEVMALYFMSPVIGYFAGLTWSIFFDWLYD